MAEAGKTFLVSVAGITVRKNREEKIYCGIEEGSISVDCRDGFVKK